MMNTDNCTRTDCFYCVHGRCVHISAVNERLSGHNAGCVRYLLKDMPRVYVAPRAQQMTQIRLRMEIQLQQEKFVAA